MDGRFAGVSGRRRQRSRECKDDHLRPCNGTGRRLRAGPDEQWCLVPPCPPGVVGLTKRWYPSLKTNRRGHVGVYDGFDNANYQQDGSGDGNSSTPCILSVNEGDPLTWTWTPLHGGDYCCDEIHAQCNCDHTAPNTFDYDTYPFVFLSSKGKLLFAGSQYQPFPSPGISRPFDPAFEVWTSETPGDNVRGMSAVMYAQDKVLKAGGGTTVQRRNCGSGVSYISTNGAQIIDISVENPSWTAVAPMNQTRLMSTLVTLADGRVLAIGGSWENVEGQPSYGDPCNPANARLHPELYDPVANTWTLLTTADTIEPRMKHHTALLLPSGAVFVAGGQSCAPPPGCFTYQIYKPPYFFGGLPGENLPPRPTITQAPDTIDYGEPFDVVTPQVLAITKVRLLRCGAVTHSFDQSAQCLELKFAVWQTAPTPTLRIQSPQHGDIAPPGYYMLVVAAGPEGRSPCEKAHMVQLK